MRWSVGIVGGGQSGNKLRADLRQGLPRIGTSIAPCSGPASPRDRHLDSANVSIRIRIFHRSYVISGDDISHFLSRCHRYTLPHASGDVFYVLHEAVETRTAKRNLAVSAIENSCRQRALERQHRKHAFLDG